MPTKMPNAPNVIDKIPESPTVPEAARLLIVDDEAPALRNLTYLLGKEGYLITAKSSGAAALQELQQRPFDVILTDLRMKGVDGLMLLRQARAWQPEAEIIVVTGYASLDSAIEIIKEGAFHYIAKPYRLEEIRQTVKLALEKVRQKRHHAQLRQPLPATALNDSKLITQDSGMQRLLATARQVSITDCNVLISGESGTGKELLARYVHQHSHRAHQRFIAINCGALQEDLLANELFGHEKGAFTGADRQKHGLIEMAEGGTLLLDEITEMSLTMQVKLLRVLQERELLRVGGTEAIAINVRFIAATNRNLQSAVDNGRFRADLFFRLNVVNLALPPLRERREDVPLLAFYFLRKFAQVMNKTVTDIAPAALQRLAHYDYPGNVRELANLIERGVALASSGAVNLTDLPDSLQHLNIKIGTPAPAYTPDINNNSELLTLEKNEAAYIAQVLAHTGGNRNQAAAILGIDRVSLWRRIKRYGLD